MRIAIVGSGVSGLVCARLLHREHEITLFEADDRVGGHSNTEMIELEGRRIPVDTGFIVYNDRNYPAFTRLLEQLGVRTTPTGMSFSVRDDRDGLEYAGGSFNGLFAQRRNLFRPRFHRLIRDILRFYDRAADLIEGEPPGTTLGEFLRRHGFEGDLGRRFIIPMGAAIWSSSTRQMLDFPAHFFVRFFSNHGMLTTRDRPQWRTIVGGSREYVSRLTGPLRDRIRTGARVRNVRRDDRGVDIAIDGDTPVRFDHVVFACHSDQTLDALADATRPEQEILGAMPYQANDVVLHWDRTLLPRRRRAWAAWNYRLGAAAEPGAVVTYNLSILQHLATREPVCVTLNQADRIDPAKILRRYTYHHPVYTIEGMRARERYDEIGAAGRTHFCGAYWFNGFHEDGIRSALRVCERFGASL